MEKEFDWKTFKNTKNKIAVHCKTEKESIDFNRETSKHNISVGDFFYKYRENTAYSCSGFSSIMWYTEFGYTILEWSDYMNKSEETNKVYRITDLYDNPMKPYTDTKSMVIYRWNNKKNKLEVTYDWQKSWEDTLSKIETFLETKFVETIKTVDFKTALHSNKLVKCINYKNEIVEGLNIAGYYNIENDYLSMNLIILAFVNHCAGNDLINFIDNSRWVIKEDQE